MTRPLLHAEPLTADAFGPFGQVIEATTVPLEINEGTTERFDDLAAVDTSASGGRTLVSIFRAVARRFPFDVDMLERHRLGSQAFVPLDRQAFVVVVHPRADDVDPGAIRAFIATGGQGVNFDAGIWHHPLLALGDRSEFLVIDRGGSDIDCDVLTVEGPSVRVERDH